MELIFLDENFNVCNIIDSYKSFAWTGKYFETGNFSLETLIDEYMDIKNNNAKYLYCKKYRETAKIETMGYNSNYTDTTVVLTGRFLETNLSDRVIKTTQTYTGTTEQIARQIVLTNCINCEKPLFNGNLQLGEYKGLGQKRVYQNTGDDIETALYNLLKLDGLSYNIDYDYENDTLTFNVWSGLDRTDNQAINSWAMFCKDFDNIQNDKYSTDETQYKNFAYVAGEGVGGNRVVVEVDHVGDNEERKELYVDARDLQQDEDVTNSEYIEMLKQRGEEKLQEHNKVEVVEFEIDDEANLKLGTDYNLGDIVMYKNNELGINVDNRIVEITNVIENGNETTEIVFGDDYNIKKVIK